MTEQEQDKVRVQHILNAITEVLKHTQGMSYGQFVGSPLVLQATLYQMAIIGEASNKLSRKLRSLHTEVDWRETIRLRNIIIHDYFGVSLQFVWSTIETTLPLFKKQIETILQQLD